MDNYNIIPNQEHSGSLPFFDESAIEEKDSAGDSFNISKPLIGNSQNQINAQHSFLQDMSLMS